MMIKVAIAIGIGVCAVTVAFCWGLWKLRHRMRTGQISATPEEIPVENRKGFKNDAVLPFPTIHTSDAQLQCRICLLGFRDDDVVRQLPQCHHMFHKHCIDPVLNKRRTCPLCSSRVTTETSESHTNLEPSWILVNQPVPLPRTALSDSSSERFEIDLSRANSKGDSPLLKARNKKNNINNNSNTSIDDNVDDDDDLEKCIDISFTFSGDIPVEKRQQILNSCIDKGTDNSFSFTFPGLESGSRKDFSSSCSSTRHSRSTSRSSRATNSSSDYGQASEFYYNTNNENDQFPLTKPPLQCSFELMPVNISSSGNSHSLRPPLKFDSNRNSYSHL